MSTTLNRPIALAVGGFDPSAGAGVLADVKTMEVHGVHGLAVVSANTIQTDNYFESIHPLLSTEIFRQVELLVERFDFQVVKIGLVHSLSFLEELLRLLHGKTIVWDPVLKASAGFELHKTVQEEKLLNILSKTHLITPNLPEAERIFGDISGEKLKRQAVATGCNILLKGGHSKGPANDLLISNTGQEHLCEGERFQGNHDKHGTGCMLSSAIAAQLSKGASLPEACRQGKRFVEASMLSNSSLLADIYGAAKALETEKPQA